MNKTKSDFQKQYARKKLLKKFETWCAEHTEEELVQHDKDIVEKWLKKNKLKPLRERDPIQPALSLNT
jgi:hypothetical protein